MENISSLNHNYLQILRQSPLFNGLPRQSLQNMLPAFVLKQWVRGSYLPPEQDEQYFYIITTGRIKIQRSHPDTGRSVTIGLLGPGDGFDIISLLDKKIHEVTKVTLDTVEAFMAPLATVRQWLTDYPDFNRSFLPYLGQQMRYMEDLSTDLALHDTITRLSRLILHYIDKEITSSLSSQHPVHLISDLSHESLASMVGSVRTVVNRHLQQLKKEGAVEFHRGHLAVKNLEALASHAKQSLTNIEKLITKGKKSH